MLCIMMLAIKYLHEFGHHTYFVAGWNYLHSKYGIALDESKSTPRGDLGIHSIPSRKWICCFGHSRLVSWWKWQPFGILNSRSTAVALRFCFHQYECEYGLKLSADCLIRFRYFRSKVSLVCTRTIHTCVSLMIYSSQKCSVSTHTIVRVWIFYFCDLFVSSLLDRGESEFQLVASHRRRIQSPPTVPRGKTGQRYTSLLFIRWRSNGCWEAGVWWWPSW